VLVSRRQADAAIAILEDVLKRSPQYENGYVTLAKIQYSVGRSREAVGVLERLLQRNPQHPVAVDLLRQWKGR
jgi:predicted Zn-dependent protease